MSWPAPTCDVCLAPGLGEAHVCNLGTGHLVPDCHQQVGRLEVKVHQVLAVEVGQALVAHSTQTTFGSSHTCIYMFCLPRRDVFVGGPRVQGPVPTGHYS